MLMSLGESSLISGLTSGDSIQESDVNPGCTVYSPFFWREHASRRENPSNGTNDIALFLLFDRDASALLHIARIHSVFRFRC